MFRLVKEIRSKAGDLHFRRWAILDTAILRVYVHQILRADEDDHLHTHPWHFISTILAGSYTERTETSQSRRTPGSVAFRRATTPHKILTVHKPCWTLVIAYGRRQDWGFKPEDGSVMPNEEYRKRKHS